MGFSSFTGLIVGTHESKTKLYPPSPSVLELSIPVSFELICSYLQALIVFRLLRNRHV